MKKRNLIAAILCSACLVAGSVNPVFADASKVVTLGADLTDAQKQTMMKYFNVSADQVQIMTITNQDEHNHLDNIAPQSQIGSRTLSCAYVKPTQSGGIKVRTANLNWVTGNMIASSLSTSGVKNCEVVAACPMEVSGTGALAGIQMAYEKASGQKLDETKTKLANEEIVTTGELADKVGKNEATTVVNQSKIDVIQNNVQNTQEIQNIVVNVAQENNVSVSQEEIDKIVSLLEKIAEQGYDYDDVKDTLEQVDANTTGKTTTDDSLDGENTDETVDPNEATDDDDDIMNNVDESALGGDVIQSSTEDPDLEKETGDSTDSSSETGIPEATDDGTYVGEDSTDESTDDTVTVDESTADESSADESLQKKLTRMKQEFRKLRTMELMSVKTVLMRAPMIQLLWMRVQLMSPVQMKALQKKLTRMKQEFRKQQGIQTVLRKQKQLEKPHQQKQTAQKLTLRFLAMRQRTTMTDLPSLRRENTKGMQTLFLRQLRIQNPQPQLCWMSRPERALQIPLRRIITTF